MPVVKKLLKKIVHIFLKLCIVNSRRKLFAIVSSTYVSICKAFISLIFIFNVKLRTFRSGSIMQNLFSIWIDLLKTIALNIIFCLAFSRHVSEEQQPQIC